MCKWEEANMWEAKWHGNCVNSYHEESKQIEYAKRMGLKVESVDGRYPVIDFHGQSVVDIGGGPYSLLLKGINVKGMVVDPCEYPQWVYDRYMAAGITVVKKKAEDCKKGGFDVGLIYNVLQHVENPEIVIENMKSMCTVIYIHEWLNTPVSDGHIHTIRETDLNKWFGGHGVVGEERWSDTVVTPYYTGVFI